MRESHWNDLLDVQEVWVRLRGNKANNLLAVLSHKYVKDQRLTVRDRVHVVLQHGERVHGYAANLRHMPLGHCVSVPTAVARDWGLTKGTVIQVQVFKA